MKKFTHLQRDMLQTINDNGEIYADPYRLAFSPDLQKWARDQGYVKRVRGKYRLTPAGLAALSPPQSASEG